MHARGRTRRGKDFRLDIEGLRAVAILAVVAYHSHLAAISGGYVGVDVFFVISGYLITAHLTKELRKRGRIAFGAFYGRRARRLLPSAVLVIVATLAVSAVVLPPLEVHSVVIDAIFSSLYCANYHFAAQATNYLTASGPPSPFLHFWSLGVEEQFYLVWPALLVGVAFLWRRRSRLSLRGASVALVVLWGVSFACCLWLTKANEPWAFYSLPTRAWELATGGLLAVGLPWAAEQLRRAPSTAATFGAASSWLLGWAGLAAIVWSTVSLTPSTPFPGTAALVPVLGAAAVIGSGSLGASRRGPALLLERAPLPALGRVSYTWYLWHWPALVLAPHVVGHALTTAQDVGVSVGSLGLAIATSLLLERPAQRSSWLSRSSLRSLGLAAALSGIGVLAAGVTTVSAPSLTGEGTAVAARLGTGGPRGPLAPGPTAGNPLLTEASQVTAQVQAAVDQGVAIQDVPANVTPSLANASADEASPFVDGCFDGFTDTTVHPCNYGDVSSQKTMVLFGDSHALMWFPAFENIAHEQGWHLIAQAKATCPPIDVPIFSPDLGEPYTQCTQWRNNVVARIAAIHPAVVVLGFSREYGISNDHVVVDGPAWMQGLTKMITTLRATGAQVVVMGDDPYPPGLVPNCLSAHLTDVPACDIAKAPPAFNQPGVAQERAVVTAAGGVYIDTEPWFCAATTCAVMVGNMIVYRDDNHITATYASWLTPVIQADLDVATNGLV